MFVYIIQSLQNDTFYKGITSNLEKRLKDHNAGRSTYTKKFMPWKLVYSEECENRKEARNRELFLKTSDGKKSVLKYLS